MNYQSDELKDLQTEKNNTEIKATRMKHSAWQDRSKLITKGYNQIEGVVLKVLKFPI